VVIVVDPVDDDGEATAYGRGREASKTVVVVAIAD
jgi:hypothetical protein